LKIRLSTLFTILFDFFKMSFLKEAQQIVDLSKEKELTIDDLLPIFEALMKPSSKDSSPSGMPSGPPSGCSHILTRGQRQNEPCGKKPKAGTDRCSVHTPKGSDTSKKSDTPKTSTSTEDQPKSSSSGCCHVFSRGQFKGSTCGKKTKPDTDRCSLHTLKKKDTPKEEEVPKEEEKKDTPNEENTPKEEVPKKIDEEISVPNVVKEEMPKEDTPKEEPLKKEKCEHKLHNGVRKGLTCDKDVKGSIVDDNGSEVKYCDIHMKIHSRK
jgi:hypothetical protein